VTIETGTAVQKVVYMKAPGERAIAEERFAEYATAWGLRLSGIDEEKGWGVGRGLVRYCAHLTVVDPERFQAQWDAAKPEGGEINGE
jgi:hypothetical protein